MQHSISVSVSGANLAEVRANLLNLASHLPVEGGAPAVQVTEDTAPQATRKPRQTKAEKETAALVNGKDDSNIFSEAPPAPAPVSQAKTYTKDDVNTAVQGVLNKVGGAETRKLLGQFGATSTGGVKVEDYAKLIAACEKLAA